jgi:hypothetical protein
MTKFLMLTIMLLLLLSLLLCFVEINGNSSLRSWYSSNDERQLTVDTISNQQHKHNHNHHRSLPVCSLYDISFKGIWKQTNAFFGNSESVHQPLITGNSRYRPGGKDFICCGWDTNDYLDGEIADECGKKAVDQMHYTGDPTHLGKYSPLKTLCRL